MWKRKGKNKCKSAVTSREYTNSFRNKWKSITSYQKHKKASVNTTVLHLRVNQLVCQTIKDSIIVLLRLKKAFERKQRKKFARNKLNSLKVMKKMRQGSITLCSVHGRKLKCLWLVKRTYTTNIVMNLGIHCNKQFSFEAHVNLYIGTKPNISGLRYAFSYTILLDILTVP